jgi:alkylation response protein AidB-like acyl-CoA dehydrogenase
MTMDFTPTEAQRALSALTAQILHDRVGPEQLRRLDQETPHGGDRFDPQLWDALAETGVLSAALPRKAGGDGHGLLEMCSVLVELGRALAPVPYRSTIAMAGSVLARFGTAQQQAEWLKPALAGRSVLAVALAEPDGGDLLSPSTRAEPTPIGWRLTGSKTTVLAGPLAQLILVSASTPNGPRLFAVTEDDAGVQISRQQMIDHDDAGWLELDGVELPASRLIGPRLIEPRLIEPRLIGSGDPVRWVVRWGTVALCAQQLGVLERALELTAQYATTRTQFDRPIGTFQAVAQRLADAFIQVQGLRLALWSAAWTLHTAVGQTVETTETPVAEPAVIRAVAIAKFWAAEAGHHVAHTCVHVHGGAGIDVEHSVHRYFLAAKRAEFELGGATAQLLTLGALLAEGFGSG